MLHASLLLTKLIKCVPLQQIVSRFVAMPQGREESPGNIGYHAS